MQKTSTVVYEITVAVAADVDGIATLLQANAPPQGGLLTGEFPRDKVDKMVLGDMPVVVARRAGRVVGVLLSSAKDNPMPPPSVQAMLQAWPGSEDAYVYGPVCIADTERRRGLLKKLYKTLQLHLPGREAVLFIRRDNVASIRAHERLGMHEVAGFTLEGKNYTVFSSNDCN